MEIRQVNCTENDYQADPVSTHGRYDRAETT